MPPPMQTKFIVRDNRKNLTCALPEYRWKGNPDTWQQPGPGMNWLKKYWKDKPAKENEVPLQTFYDKKTVPKVTKLPEICPINDHIADDYFDLISGKISIPNVIHHPRVDYIKYQNQKLYEACTVKTCGIQTKTKNSFKQSIKKQTLNKHDVPISEDHLLNDEYRIVYKIKDIDQPFYQQIPYHELINNYMTCPVKYLKRKKMFDMD